MITTVVKAEDANALKASALALSQGSLVAFPTETVYGLGANALDEEAVKRIFAAKGRPSDNPLIVHIAHADQLGELVGSIPHIAKPLMDAFWPGPLTLVFKKSDKVPAVVTAGLDTVAVRMPQNETALKLLKWANVPVAAPSANLSGRPSPTAAEHVLEDLNGKVEYIVDGGSCEVGVESTVLDITSEVPAILRPGGITQEMIERVIGPIEADRAFKAEGNIKPRSPGMKYRHYSPKAEMFLVCGNEEKVICRIHALIQESAQKGQKAGVLTTSENASLYRAPVVVSVGSKKRLEEVAAGLYKALRKFDDEKVDIIYSETFEEQGIGQAVMNRLRKAASDKTINV